MLSEFERLFDVVSLARGGGWGPLGSGKSAARARHVVDSKFGLTHFVGKLDQAHHVVGAHPFGSELVGPCNERLVCALSVRRLCPCLGRASMGVLLG